MVPARPGKEPGAAPAPSPLGGAVARLRPRPSGPHARPKLWLGLRPLGAGLGGGGTGGDLVRPVGWPPTARGVGRGGDTPSGLRPRSWGDHLAPACRARARATRFQCAPAQPLPKFRQPESATKCWGGGGLPDPIPGRKAAYRGVGRAGHWAGRSGWGRGLSKFRELFRRSWPRNPAVPPTERGSRAGAPRPRLRAAAQPRHFSSSWSFCFFFFFSSPACFFPDTFQIWGTKKS